MARQGVERVWGRPETKRNGAPAVCGALAREDVAIDLTDPEESVDRGARHRDYPGEPTL